MDINLFLSLKDEFSLGHLTTEGFHPLSQNLSDEAKNNLNLALANFQKIDREAIGAVKSHLNFIYELAEDIHTTLAQGKKVFLSGCGATGRLALTLEKIFAPIYPDQVIAFMAGGDYALIKSVESFEDESSYGPRQLIECGYRPGDLVIAITEAGETSFVIGSALHAVEQSGPKPWIFFCNDPKDLVKIARCKEYLDSDQVKKLSLNVGPMALSGSTRLQASTIQMLVTGLCFEFGMLPKEAFQKKCLNTIDKLLDLNYDLLKPLIKCESNLYLEGKNLTYICESDYAISILTDTTERSPTFNLLPFENNAEAPIARCYLAIKGATSSEQAWKKMLGRSPRAIDWSELAGKINLTQVYGFDISEKSIQRRGAEPFHISVHSDVVEFHLASHQVFINLQLESKLYRHLVLKLLLNCHSTLVMGRLDRYQGNVMTWVKPSNFKLIDRASRYALEILRQQKIETSFIEVAQKIITNSNLKDGSIVLKVVSEVVSEIKKGN